MDEELKRAIAVIRKRGVRVPRTFMAKLKDHRKASLNRKSLKRLREVLEGAETREKFVVSVLGTGKVCVWKYEVYQGLVKNAKGARDAFGKQKKIKHEISKEAVK